MTGLVLALLAGFCLAASFAFIRRGVHRSGEVSSTIPIFAFVGLVFFGFPVVVSGEIGQLTSLSWLGFSCLATAGVIHFILGRIFGFTSIRLIGANRAVPIHTCNILFATLLGILLLGEPFTIFLFVAVFLVFGGIIIIGTTGNANKQKQVVVEGSLSKGIFMALGAALCWGVSPALVKIGLREVNSPVLAALISYAAASAVIGIWLFQPKNVDKLRRVDRSSLTPILIAAVTMSVAHLLRYSALSYSALTAVQPLFSTHGLFIFPLSFLINRKIEAFGTRVIMGAIAVVLGVFLIFWST